MPEWLNFGVDTAYPANYLSGMRMMEQSIEVKRLELNILVGSNLRNIVFE
ncbi:MAG: hypothetical protein HRT38_18410 [Alteromonadaceae bacterium]|nr:hypothetical protein [Alteromonadaceae bacterium]